MSFLKTWEMSNAACDMSPCCFVRDALAEQYSEKTRFTVNICSPVDILSIWWCRVRRFRDNYRIWVFSQGHFGSMHKTWSVLIRAKLGIFWLEQ